MSDLSVEILAVREELAPTPRGEIVQMRVVEFMVGTHGPFKVRLPASDFTPDAARALVDAEADKIRRLLGA